MVDPDLFEHLTMTRDHATNMARVTKDPAEHMAWLQYRQAIDMQLRAIARRERVGRTRP
jgi:hypothetical protein